MKRQGERKHWWCTVGGVLIALGGLALPPSVLGEGAADAAREARRVLAAGYELPPGLTSLKRGRELSVFDVNGRGAVRERYVRTVTGTFELDGDVITFETRRGRRISGQLRDEDDPKYELDVCFKDAEGRAFVVQMGGDYVLDPTCDPELEEEPAGGEGLGVAFTAEDREADFTMAGAAIQALQGVQFRRSFADEYQALIGQAALVARAQLPLEPDCDGETVFCEPEEPAGAVSGASGDYRWRHIIDVYSGPVTYFPIVTHGATVTYRQDPRNGRISRAWHDCNGGKCYWHWRMSWLCGFWSAFNRTDHVHHEDCTTWYSPSSGAMWGWPGHNCNDDTSIQYQAVRNNRHYPSGWGSGWPCDDTQWHSYTSGCW